MRAYAPFPNAFMGAVALSGKTLGQEITDPRVLARVDLADAFGQAVKAVSQVVQVPPEMMAASVESAKLTFQSLIKNPSFIGYAMKVLILAAVMVKEDIRALGFTPQQLWHVLKGADEAIREVVPAAEMPAKLKSYEQEIISRAPVNIQTAVTSLLESSGVTAEDLAPNVPVGAEIETLKAVQETEGLSGLQIAALIGIPVAILAAIGIVAK